MRKIILVLLICSLAFVGCSIDGLNDESSSSEETVQHQKEYKKVSVYLPYSTNHRYWDQLREDHNPEYWTIGCDHDVVQVPPTKEVTLFGKTYQFSYFGHRDNRRSTYFLGCSDSYRFQSDQGPIRIEYVHGTNSIQSISFPYETTALTEQEYLQEITKLLQEIPLSDSQKYLIEREGLKYGCETSYRPLVDVSPQNPLYGNSRRVKGFYLPDQDENGLTDMIDSRNFYFFKTAYGIQTDEMVMVNWDNSDNRVQISIHERGYEEADFSVRKGKYVKNVLDAYFMEKLGEIPDYKNGEEKEVLRIVDGRVLSKVQIVLSSATYDFIIDWNAV